MNEKPTEHYYPNVETIHKKEISFFLEYASKLKSILYAQQEFQEQMLALQLAVPCQFVLQAMATGQLCASVEEETAQVPEFSTASI